MADTVITYVKKYGDYTFIEKPLNDVDSLVLCQLSYLKFDGLVPSLKPRLKAVSLRQVAADKAVDALFLDKRYEESNRALFEAVCKSRRYRRLKMNYYVNHIDTEQETQFSAITFFLEGGLNFIAFRGTDETLIGWKEDFNMAFQTPVPGQRYAVDYLETVAENLPRDFCLGGHSKGGNFAVYASMSCRKEIRERIQKIYSMDGPGFLPQMLKKGEYAEIENRIVKILPNSSLVGMLFETSPRYKVVKSKSFGLLQHDPYSWLIEGDDFLCVKGIYGLRRFTDDTLNIWICSLNPEKRKLLIDTIYQVISASRAENLIELAADWKKSMTGVLTGLKEVDADTRRILISLMKDFVEMIAERLRAVRSIHKRSKET
ncbi:MAG: DUF2974 domain-containing protein [Lachnospiraceae bacterium]|nr:DUF2974 domain-containing protein [Lachnospiraceae bacterium]